MVKIVWLISFRSPDGDIVAGVLRRDTLAPYCFIICLDYVLRTSIDKIKENGFKLTKKRNRKYPQKTITNADNADDIVLQANVPAQAEILLHSLEWAVASIGLHVNAHKTEYMCFNQTGDISTLNGSSLKLVDKFTYLGNSVSSTETVINTRLVKTWTAIDRLSVIWKSDLTDKIKHSFFQVAVVSILLFGCTTWTLTKRMEKRLDSNYTRILRAILNKSWRQHPTKQQLYGHLPPITKTIKVRQNRHVGHCWRSRDELISDVLRWTLQRHDDQLEPTYSSSVPIIGCIPEDLPEAMDDREGWWERVRDFRADGVTWWWWWWWLSFYKDGFGIKWLMKIDMLLNKETKLIEGSVRNTQKVTDCHKHLKKDRGNNSRQPYDYSHCSSPRKFMLVCLNTRLFLFHVMDVLFTNNN